MKPATPKQLQYIHAILHRKGLLYCKAEMVSGYTGGRTESSKEMTIQEAAQMLSDLNVHKEPAGEKDKMIRKIIAMAREMGVVSREPVVDSQGAITEKSNYTRLNQWMLEKSCLKKDMNAYSYQELPKLVYQYEAIYKDWLKKKR